MDTTLDEARRCPKCDELGQKHGERYSRDRSKEVTYLCMNERCRWYGQVCRVITVRPDGTIPAPRKQHIKSFPSLGADRTAQVQASLDRQRDVELGRGGEVR